MLALPGVLALFDRSTLAGSELVIVTGTLPAGATMDNAPPEVS
jgi:hypothetical protein